MYGAPEEIASDGGLQFQSLEYKQFLQHWGMNQCLSSAYFAQSNGHAESTVKTVKLVLMDNTDTTGQLDYDCTSHALLTHSEALTED